jgi:heme/copper-type cytochrome/quinol oxidase subunit 2
MRETPKSDSISFPCFSAFSVVNVFVPPEILIVFLIVIDQDQDQEQDHEQDLIRLVAFVVLILIMILLLIVFLFLIDQDQEQDQEQDLIHRVAFVVLIMILILILIAFPSRSSLPFEPLRLDEPGSVQPPSPLDRLEAKAQLFSQPPNDRSPLVMRVAEHLGDR